MAWYVPVKWHFQTYWLKHKTAWDSTRKTECWERAQLPHSPPHTFVPGNDFADKVLLWPPRFHSELQLQSAEIVLFPCLCAQGYLGVFTRGPASQTQLPEKDRKRHSPRQDRADIRMHCGVTRPGFDSWLHHLHIGLDTSLCLCRPVSSRLNGENDDDTRRVLTMSGVVLFVYPVNLRIATLWSRFWSPFYTYGQRQRKANNSHKVMQPWSCNWNPRVSNFWSTQLLLLDCISPFISVLHVFCCCC